MKVIVAGFSKTGTKTMVAALQQLDYKVYDYLDHFWYHGEDWEKILDFGPGGNIDDFKRMYEDVDAVTDAPAFAFWEEIHQAFPDSKIILTTRDEDKFYKSFMGQVKAFKGNLLYILIQIFTPTGRRYARFVFDCLRLMFGFQLPRVMNPKVLFSSWNEMMIRRAFRQHQAYCLQNASKDRLLVYNVKEGWEPLCNFLDKDIPKKPFPHENVSGRMVDSLMANHPVLLRMQREMKIVVAAMLGIGAFTAYYYCNPGTFRNPFKLA